MSDMTPEDWARWAILGAPEAPVPITQKEVIERVRQAVYLAVREERKACADICRECSGRVGDALAQEIEKRGKQ